MLRNLFFIALVISLFFTSCSLEKKHYSTGYHIDWNVSTPIAKVANSSANELNNYLPSNSNTSNSIPQSLINSNSNPPSNTHNQTTVQITTQTSPKTRTNFTSVLATRSNFNPSTNSIHKISSSNSSSVNYFNSDNYLIIKHKASLKSLVNLVKKERSLSSAISFSHRPQSTETVAFKYSESYDDSFDNADLCAILSVVFLILPFVSLPLAIKGLKSQKSGLRILSGIIMGLSIVYLIILLVLIIALFSAILTLSGSH